MTVGAARVERSPGAKLLPQLGPGSHEGLIRRRLPRRLRELHEAVVMRAERARANALILTGSTARGTRTELSDLDYHVIGATISVGDLSRELDLHPLSAHELRERVLAGDDFVHWSLRLGLIVFDDGVVRDARAVIDQRRLWPNADRKRSHALKSLALAHRFVESGDVDGSVQQVRTALSLAARAYLLSSAVFPLSRAELSAQLAAAGEPGVASALTATLFAAPSLDELATGVRAAETMLSES